MQLHAEDLSPDIKLVRLEGRLDIQGTEEVEPQFSYITSTHQWHIVVDMSRVTFLASIGIRSLLSAARAQSIRGGKLVIACPAGMVARVLETAGVDLLVPIYRTLPEALAGLQA